MTLSPEAMTREAQRLLAAGLSLIPIRPDGSKRATRAWKRYQRKPPTAQTLASWFQHGEGLALICGAVSASLEVLDFDAPELFPPWCALVEELCSGLLARLPLVQTPSDGRHVYHRCPSIQGNQKLAQRLTADGQPETTIETRGEGGYAIIPPSPPACHPLRRPYVLLRGDLAQIPTITPAERQLLLNAARTFHTYVTPERIVSGTRETPRANGGERDRPGDAYTAQASWPPLLETYGWQRVGQRGEVTLWKRPGKREPGCSATTNYGGSNLLYVFSTNAHPFEAEHAYTLFAAFALLAHQGDFTAAARKLVALGYGQPPHRQPRLPRRDPWLGPRELVHGIPLDVQRLGPEGRHGA